MKLSELVQEGDTRKPGTEKFYVHGREKDCRATKRKPLFARDTRSVTVAVAQLARGEVTVTVRDVATGKELLVQVQGIGEIEPQEARRAAEIHAVFTTLEQGVAYFVRKGLQELSARESLLQILFRGEEKPRVDAVLQKAFHEVGVTLTKLELRPRFRIGDNEVDAEQEHITPRKELLVKGQSQPIEVFLKFILRLDPDNIAAAITATAAEAAIDDCERLSWSWLNGNHTAQDFRVGAPSLEADLKAHINQKIGPKHGRLVSYLRIEAPDRVAESNIVIDERRHHRHDQEYEIRGTKRKIPLSHEFGWRLPSNDLDRSRYSAGGQYDGLTKRITSEIDEVTKNYLQKKTFGDVLFEFYANREDKQKDLGEQILKQLSNIAAQFGVAIEDGVTTTLGRIDEALLFEGGRIHIPRLDYQLKEANQKIALSAEVPLHLERTSSSNIKDKLRNLLDGEKDKEGILGGRIIEVTQAAMRAILTGTDTKSFLNSSLCGRENRDLDAKFKQQIANDIAQKFGLTVDADLVQISTEECPLITLSEQLLGQQHSVDITSSSLLYDENADFVVEPVRQVRLQIRFTIRDIGIERTPVGRQLDETSRGFVQEEFFHRYVQTISAYPALGSVVEQVKEVVRAVSTNFLSKIYLEVFRPDVVDEAKILQDLSVVLQKQVLRDTGLWIEVLPNQISIQGNPGILISSKLKRGNDNLLMLEGELDAALNEEAIYGPSADTSKKILRLENRIKVVRQELKDEQSAMRPESAQRAGLLEAYKTVRKQYFITHHIPLLEGPPSSDNSSN